MLEFKMQDGEICYIHYGAGVSSPFLYNSERWAETGSDLLCGIAQRTSEDGGACVILPAAYRMADEYANRDPQKWIRIGSGKYLSAGGCYFAMTASRIVVFPDTREGIEAAIQDALPFYDKERDVVENGASIFAFEGWSSVRKRILDMSEDDAAAFADQLDASRLFSIRVGWAAWGITPGTVSEKRILAVHQPVLDEISSKAQG